MTSLIDERRQTEFRLYPTNHLIAIIRERENAEAALQALVAAGFPKEALRVATGEEGAELIDPQGEHHPGWGQFWRFLQHLADEHGCLEQYAAAARQGHFCLAVHTPHPGERETAQRILEQHGGHYMRFCGRLVVERIAA